MDFRSIIVVPDVCNKNANTNAAMIDSNDEEGLEVEFERIRSSRNNSKSKKIMNQKKYVNICRIPGTGGRSATTRTAIITDAVDCDGDDDEGMEVELFKKQIKKKQKRKHRIGPLQKVNVPTKNSSSSITILPYRSKSSSSGEKGRSPSVPCNDSSSSNIIKCAYWQQWFASSRNSSSSNTKKKGGSGGNNSSDSGDSHIGTDYDSQRSSDHEMRKGGDNNNKNNSKNKNAAKDNTTDACCCCFRSCCSNNATNCCTQQRRSRLTSVALGFATLACIGAGTYLFLEQRGVVGTGRTPSSSRNGAGNRGNGSTAATFITQSELAAHNAPGTDCWLALHGDCYDLTAYEHPGGPESIWDHCGTDATSAFRLQQHPKLYLQQLVPHARVGALTTDDTTTATTDDATAKPAETTIAPTASPPVVFARCYEAQEVAELHSQETDSCWFILYDLVYDFTDYADKHPGGSQYILSECGSNNATAVFSAERLHNARLLEVKASQYLKGPVCT